MEISHCRKERKNRGRVGVIAGVAHEMRREMRKKNNKTNRKLMRDLFWAIYAIHHVF